MKKPRLKALFLSLLAALVFTDFFLLGSILKERHRQDFVNFSPTIGPTKSANPKKITLAFVGDIGLVREVNWQIHQKGDPTFPFQKTAEILKRANLTIGNLEGPLVRNCPLVRTGMKFCGSPENARGLAFAGFDLMNLANNHINNYGPEGVKQTVKTLKKHQIDYFDSEKTAFKTINGFSIAFLGFNDIGRGIDEEKLIQKIQEAKSQADLVIVNFHWGSEYQSQPTRRQRYLAHLAINHGADLVVGHHPHVLQPIEHYQNKPIFYSLGNFVFDQMWSKETRIGAIALVKIDRSLKAQIELVPIRIHFYCQPQLIPEAEKSIIINRIFPLK